MAASQDGNIGIWSGYTAGDNGWTSQHNSNWDALDALVQPSVKNATTTTPPGSPSNGDAYIVASGATGAWSGKTNQIAVWVARNSAWAFYVPKNGWVCSDQAAGYQKFYTGTVWVSTAIAAGSVIYIGTWNASTNTPTLASGVGTKGNYYKVSVSGTTSIDGISQWNAGDVIIFNGTTWDKIDGVSSEVISVFGQVGAVPNLSGDVTTSGSSVVTLANTAAARTNIGLGTASSPTFTGLSLSAFSSLNLNAAAAPSALSGTALQIAGLDATQTRILIDTFAANGQITFRRADGTNSSPSAIQLNDTVGNISAFGYGASAYSSSARASINFVASSAWSDTGQGTAINLITTLNGTVSAAVRLSLDGLGNIITIGGVADQGYSYQTPTTGFSITIGAQIQTLILDPAGTLATGTITMPASPVDGQIVRINSTQNITALTVSPNTGQSIKNAPTAFSTSTTGPQGYAFIYRVANTTWYRLV